MGDPDTKVLLVAAVDTDQDLKDRADYLCDGVDDHVQIEAAMEALPDGGSVTLLPGTFVMPRFRLADGVSIKHWGGMTVITDGGLK